MPTLIAISGKNQFSEETREMSFYESSSLEIHSNLPRMAISTNVTLQ